MFSLDELITVLVKMMEAKDSVLSAHSLRVGYYAAQIARLQGMSEEECQILRVGGVLHDIGKVGIPDEILKKPGKLTEEEFELMREHTYIGYQILRQLKSLKRYALVAKDHHLRPDGQGYPKAENGKLQYKDYDRVHAYTKMVTVADVFDVLWAGRVYSKRKPLHWIVNEFRVNVDKQFDGPAVEALIEYLKQRYGEDALVEPKKVKVKKAA